MFFSLNLAFFVARWGCSSRIAALVQAAAALEPAHVVRVQLPVLCCRFLTRFIPNEGIRLQICAPSKYIEQTHRSMSIPSPLIFAIPLAAALFALFLPFLNSEFILDDGHKIVENHDIRDPALLPWSLFPHYSQGERDLSLQFRLNRNDPSRPLTFLMFTLEYWIAGGARPWMFRFVNVVLHGTNGVMLYSLMKLLRVRLGIHVQGVSDLNVEHTAAILLWVFSPLNLSTVNYIYSRSEILGFTLELCCLHLLLRHRKRNLGAGFAMLLALCAKQSYLCIVPCVFVLFILFPSLCSEAVTGLQMHPASRKLSALVAFSALKQSLPCIVPAVLYMVYRFIYLGGLGDLEADPSNKPVPLTHYLRTQPFAIYSYILITCSGGMAVDHGVLVDDPVLIFFPCLIIVSLFMISCIFFYRPPFAFHAVLFGWAIALAHLAPTSLLVTTDVMADRRFYVSSFPLLLLICSFVRALYSNQSKRISEQTNSLRDVRSTSILFVGAFGVILIVCASVAYHHLDAYKTNISAWRSVLKLYPVSVRARNNLATSLIKQCRLCPPGVEFALQSVREPSFDEFQLWH